MAGCETKTRVDLPDSLQVGAMVAKTLVMLQLDQQSSFYIAKILSTQHPPLDKVFSLIKQLTNTNEQLSDLKILAARKIFLKTKLNTSH